MLIQVSNVFRNGKCLSYKHNWEDIKISRQDVHRLLVDVCKNVLLVDMRAKEMRRPRIMNRDLFILGDVRKKIEEIPDNEIDVVITSPPYLNSRDYTDTYRLELWILGYVSTYNEERSIRESALTSHVQVDLKNFSCPDIKGLKSYLKYLESLNGQLWNKDIPNMIKGYFHDMENILVKMRRKLKKKGKVYINVSNSAYYGKICEVDAFIAEIALNNGYNPLEIKIARYLKSSSQQKLSERIRESVIVLQRD